jgi:hypothetical protein
MHKLVSYLLLHLGSVHSYYNAVTLESVQDRQPLLPVSGTVAGRSYTIHLSIKCDVSYLLLQMGSIHSCFNVVRSEMVQGWRCPW